MRRFSVHVFFLLVTLSFLTTIFFIFTSDEDLEDGEDVEMVRRNIDTHFDSDLPNIVYWDYMTKGQREIKQCPGGSCNIIENHFDYSAANAFLFYASTINFKKLPLPRKPDDIWVLMHEESPRNVEELMYEEILNLFNFSSTFSRYSDLPFPLQHMRSIECIRSRKFYIETPEKNELLKEIAPILFIHSDCHTSTERDAYVKELQKYIKIDSYGKCLNNKQLPENLKKDYLNNLHSDEFLKFVARYKFTLAIENGVCEDYVTEKFWRPIEVGSVPIYFGSPSIKDWLPNKKSALLLTDYPTPKLLSKQIKKLLRNDTLYEEYLQHKIKGTISNKKLHEEIKLRPYQLDYSLIMEALECFVCNKLHERNNEVHIVKKSHYNCPKPISALTLNVNPNNDWVNWYRYARYNVNDILKRMRNNDPMEFRKTTEIQNVKKYIIQKYLFN